MKIGPCNKRGRFTVATRFFDGLEVNHGVNLFHGMVVLEAHRNFMSNHVEYYAIHQDFRGVPIGEITPEYQAIFTNGNPYPEWVEVPI